MTIITLTLLIIITIIYLPLLIGSEIGLKNTSFIPAKGLWRLIPTRISGWRGKDGKIYKTRWIWQQIKIEKLDTPYELRLFKCRCCGIKHKNSFCSTKDVGICRWCSGEET